MSFLTELQAIQREAILRNERQEAAAKALEEHQYLHPNWWQRLLRRGFKYDVKRINRICLKAATEGNHGVILELNWYKWIPSVPSRHLQTHYGSEGLRVGTATEAGRETAIFLMWKNIPKDLWRKECKLVLYDF